MSAQGDRGDDPEVLELIRRPEARAAAPVAESWARIEDWFAENFPAVLDTLRPGASRADLDAFERHIGHKLPEDFRESYLIHDGQDPYAEEDEEFDDFLEDHGILFGSFLPSISGDDGLRDMYRRMGPEWNELDDTVDYTFYPPGTMREFYAGPGWIPFCGDYRDYLGIDLVPGPNGVYGQVIPFGLDGEFRPVLALSFAHFLEDIADEMEAGHFAVGTPGVTERLYWLKGAERGLFGNVYREWAEAKLPTAFQQVQAPARYIPEDHAVPVSDELSAQALALVRSFLEDMHAYERRWLAIRPLEEYGVFHVQDSSTLCGFSFTSPRPGEVPKNRVQGILWDPNATDGARRAALELGKYVEQATAEKRAIWSRYLTAGERAHATSFNQSVPPRYDPQVLVDTDVREVEPGHLIVTCGAPHPPESCLTIPWRVRWHLRLEQGEWRIERRESVDDPAKPRKYEFA